MAQIKVEKDRSYRLGKGAALEATNDRLSDEYYRDHRIVEDRLKRARKAGVTLHPSHIFVPHMQQLHPTKGYRALTQKRVETTNSVETAMHGWAKLAAKITGSAVGGTHPDPRKRTWDKPHHGKRECARRRRQQSAP